MDLMAFPKLSKLLLYDYKGPKVGFSEAHVLKALFVIGEAGNIGRGRLGQILNVGQGEVRTLIKRLKESGLVRIEAEGCVLTQAGLKQFRSVSSAIPWRSPVDGKSLVLGKTSYALIVRGRSAKIRKGIEQRDAAIKSGATGALTVFYKKGRFIVPVGSENCERAGFPEPWITIRSAKPNDGDTVIVAGADRPLEAEYGALSAALTII